MTAIYRYIGPDDFSSKRTVIIDDYTSLWLCRMAMGESMPYNREEEFEAMGWAMLNRFFLHRARKKWPTFLYMVQRFSQPINPRWARGGDLARKYANTEYTTEEKFRRRERISGLLWDEFPIGIRRTVWGFQHGDQPPPSKIVNLNKPRISNWASHPNLPKKRPWGITLATAREKRYNWFFEDKYLIPGRVVVDYWGADD